MRFWDEKWDALIRPSMLEEFESLRGQRIALLSALQTFSFGEIARRLGIPEWYATEYVTDQREISTDWTGCDGNSKGYDRSGGEKKGDMPLWH